MNLSDLITSAADLLAGVTQPTELTTSSGKSIGTFVPTSRVSHVTSPEIEALQAEVVEEMAQCSGDYSQLSEGGRDITDVSFEELIAPFQEPESPQA